jgi:hypothetical protein
LSALAVLRLMSSSNRAGCSTGRSAGLGLSESCPHRRPMVGKFERGSAHRQ